MAPVEEPVLLGPSADVLTVFHVRPLSVERQPKMWFVTLPRCPCDKRMIEPSCASPNAMLPLFVYSVFGPNSRSTFGAENVLPPSVEMETAGQLSFP